MNTFKKFVSFLSVLILVLVDVFASYTASNTLHVKAVVPENYGVSFPDGAMRFGDFVFEVDFKIDFDTELDVDIESGRNESKALIETDKISIGKMKPGLNNFDFTLVYYGNLGSSYKAEILVDPNIVWLFEGDESVTVPIDVIFKQNEDCDSDIICLSSRKGQTYIEIPPAGPRENVPVLDVEVNWDGRQDLIPGTYETDLILCMRIV